MAGPPVADDGNLFRLAFDLAPVGMLAIGESGHILVANREAEHVFDYEPGMLVGISVDQLVPSAMRAGHAAHRAGFFDAPRARSMGAGRELSGLRRDGSEFPVEIGLNHVRAGRVVAIASVVDITARRAAEQVAKDLAEQARHTLKLEALGTLAGGIAHDFNNVLQGIVGYAETAQRQLREHPGVVGDLSQVLRAAERGRQLVRRILTYARENDTTASPMELEPVVREAVALLRASLPATIEIGVSVEPGLPSVLAVESLIHQVILNLGTNASHAMEQGGSLRLELASVEADTALQAAQPGLASSHLVRLSVIDNGRGMTPEVRARAFEPYYTTKPVERGSGMGLSLILGIVQSLGGAIDIQSEPGQGTRVDIWLPAARAGAAVVAAAGAAAASTPSRGAVARPLHVLFVEDEPFLAELERRQLEALDLLVTVHTSSLEALEDFRSRPDAFDILVTDHTMPHMTGLALARHATTLRPGLRVLMVSGHAEGADATELQAHGVGAVLQKPHSLMELDAVLRHLLGR